MDDLVQWLRAQLDEDDRIARAAARQRGGGTWGAERDARGILEIVGEQPHPGAYIPVVLQPDDDETTVHIAEWDPARVLREIEAKRRLLAEVFVYEAKVDGEWGCCHDANEIATGQCPEIQPQDITTLRLLVLPYADRPGYREEWRL